MHSQKMILNFYMKANNEINKQINQFRKMIFCSKDIHLANLQV